MYPQRPSPACRQTTLVNISAALSALQDKSNEVAAAFAERDRAIEAVGWKHRLLSKQKEADLTALLAVERKDLLGLVSALEGDVDAREAELAAETAIGCGNTAEIRRNLGEVTALQLERDALAAEKSRLSDMVSVAEERLADR